MAAAPPLTRATAPDPAIVYGVGHPITARRSHPSDRSTPVVPARLPAELASELGRVAQEAGLSRSSVISATLRAAAAPRRENERAELERLRREQLEGLSEVERAAARAIRDPEHRARFVALRRARHEAANAPPSKRARLADAIGVQPTPYEIRRGARQILRAHANAVTRGGTILRATRERRDQLCALLGIPPESTDEQIAAAVEAFLSAPNEQI